jgi:hypothetical protein
LGKNTRQQHWSSSSYKEERSAHSSRPKKALAAHEGTLGSQKKNRRKTTKILQPKKGSTYTGGTKATFGADESALGGQKKRREVSNSSGQQRQTAAGGI